MDPLKLLHLLMQTSALRTNTMADLGLSERPWHEIWSYSCSQAATWVPFADSKVSAGCWSPAAAVSWCPASFSLWPSFSWVTSALLTEVHQIHFAGMETQQHGLLCIHTPELNFLPFSCLFPASNKFSSTRFLGTMVHQCHHKAFSGSAVSCGLKPWQGPCQYWHSECGTSQGFRAWPVPAYRCSLATFACWEAEPDGSPSGWAKSKSVFSDWEHSNFARFEACSFTLCGLKLICK